MENGISLVLRLAILFMTAASSEIAFSKKFYSLGMFLLSVWLLTFRMAFLRAVASYIGVFQHEDGFITGGFKTFLTASNTTNVNDFLIFITLIFLFKWVLSLKQNGNKTRPDTR